MFFKSLNNRTIIEYFCLQLKLKKYKQNEKNAK